LINKRNEFKPSQLGVALMLTYNDLGIDITRPTLRAQYEKDFTLIAEGKKDKNTVLNLLNC
jgi:DNA topoisomerase-3